MATVDTNSHTGDGQARVRRSALVSLLGLGGSAAGVALRPVTAGVSLGLRAERELRGAVLRRTEAAALAGLDALLVSAFATEVVERLLGSELPSRAVGGALAGPLVEATARDLVQYGVLERVADELLAGETVDGVLERAQAADVPRRVADRLLADGVLEQTVARVLEGPELERVVESALDSAAMERLVVRVIESRLLNEAVERLLETDELWLLVDEIARSPSVTEAITHQGVGFVDEVAGGVRARSRKVDDRIESRVRRALRRKQRAAVDEDGNGA
ncbi:MAG TPA: hypothetical protein VI111_09365 [Thermoleophilaceae bacterium]